ncbi:unnamed protein product [Cuscuta campestris]|uniref:Uncharacterized protein n=1 Tax=Cuscuta campestris TaxID=132261 RepID=A0A484KFA5_9ASTE|nr:unnamed protein product [Cuscuta campestris]
MNSPPPLPHPTPPPAAGQPPAAGPPPAEGQPPAAEPPPAAGPPPAPGLPPAGLLQALPGPPQPPGDELDEVILFGFDAKMKVTSLTLSPTRMRFGCTKNTPMQISNYHTRQVGLLTNILDLGQRVKCSCWRIWQGIYLHLESTAMRQWKPSFFPEVTVPQP